VVVDVYRASEDAAKHMVTFLPLYPEDLLYLLRQQVMAVDQQER
jgi:hypothetical protein